MKSPTEVLDSIIPSIIPARIPKGRSCPRCRKTCRCRTQPSRTCTPRPPPEQRQRKKKTKNRFVFSTWPSFDNTVQLVLQSNVNIKPNPDRLTAREISRNACATNHIVRAEPNTTERLRGLGFDADCLVAGETPTYGLETLAWPSIDKNRSRNTWSSSLTGRRRRPSLLLRRCPLPLL